MRTRRITALAVAIVAGIMVATPMSAMAAGITTDTTATAITNDGAADELGEALADGTSQDMVAIDEGYNGVWTLPDSADLMWAGTQYVLVDKLTHSFAPSGAQVVSVWYMGKEYPAYYWEPANQLILHMYNPMSPVTPYSDLSDQEKEYWQGAYIEKNAAIEFETVEDYQAYTACEQYLFVFDFDRNTIEPHVEFPTGTGYVVMVDYTPEQDYYLAALSKGFMRFGIFEFEVYQYLTVDDESYYYIVSGMNQDGDVYLYQYDFMKAEAGRVDPNMLIGLRYLDERTLALRDAEDKIADYKNSVRKYAAIAIVVVVIIAFVLANIFFFRGKKKARKTVVVEDLPELDIDLEDEEDIESSQDEEDVLKPKKMSLWKRLQADDDLDEDELDEDSDEEEPEEDESEEDESVEEELEEDRLEAKSQILDNDELFYPGDTAYMRAQFSQDSSEDEEYDEDDEYEEYEENLEEELDDDDIELPPIEIELPKVEAPKPKAEEVELPEIELEQEAKEIELPKIQLEPEAIEIELPEIELEPEALEEPKPAKKAKKAKKKVEDFDDDDFDDILDEPLFSFGKKKKKKKSSDDDGIINLDDL